MRQGLRRQLQVYPSFQEIQPNSSPKRAWLWKRLAMPTEAHIYEPMTLSWERALVATLGASGVGAAAFYAHGLERMADPAQMRLWAIACALQMVTVPALLALVPKPQALEGKSGTRTKTRWSFVLLALGVSLFSGTLYLMASGLPKWLGAVTPLGGLLMMCAWLFYAIDR